MKMNNDLTEDERKAIKALERICKIMPKTLWLFAASNTLNVMKVNDSGGRAMAPNGAYDPAYCIETINIPSDGGDW